jgi:DNA excision repair protein ERCC-4
MVVGSEKATSVKIAVDAREAPSGVMAALEAWDGVETCLTRLGAGDYLVNGWIIAERKTAGGFVEDLVSGRLFRQVKKLKGFQGRSFMIIEEGNPCHAGTGTSPRAILGALVSLAVAWQLPVVFTRDLKETVECLVFAGRQDLDGRECVGNRPGSRKPRRPQNLLRYFLQGLPGVGPELAARLLLHFGSVERIVLAGEKELRAVEGIGRLKARKIRKFVTTVIPVQMELSLIRMRRRHEHQGKKNPEPARSRVGHGRNTAPSCS